MLLTWDREYDLNGVGFAVFVIPQALVRPEDLPEEEEEEEEEDGDDDDLEEEDDYWEEESSDDDWDSDGDDDDFDKDTEVDDGYGDDAKGETFVGSTTWTGASGYVWKVDLYIEGDDA